MNSFFNMFPSNIFNDNNSEDLDINKLLVILLLLTGKLQVEAIHIYQNNFAITLGTFEQ